MPAPPTATRANGGARRVFGIGMQEMLVIFVIALIVFGPKRLPELARTLGRSLGEFRRASADLRAAVLDPPPARPRPPAPEPAPGEDEAASPASPSGPTAAVPPPGEGPPAAKAKTGPEGAADARADGNADGKAGG